MGVYPYLCHDCGAHYRPCGSMQDPPVISECVSCGSNEVYRDWSGAQFRVFKSYTEEGVTGNVELSSFKERDAFFNAHEITADSHRYSKRKPKPTLGELVREKKDEIVGELYQGKRKQHCEALVEPRLPINESRKVN